MKKIPTLFERVFENHAVIHITDRVTPGCEKALTGELKPTLKRTDFGLDWPVKGVTQP